jgi:hypothetical protein
LLCDRRRAARCVSPAQHFAPGPRSERDAVRTGGGLQGGEQVFRIEDPVRIGHMGQALLFDQMPRARQQSQDARDDLVEQRL